MTRQSTKKGEGTSDVLSRSNHEMNNVSMDSTLGCVLSALLLLHACILIYRHGWHHRLMRYNAFEIEHAFGILHVESVLLNSSIRRTGQSANMSQHVSAT